MKQSNWSVEDGPENMRVLPGAEDEDSLIHQGWVSQRRRKKKVLYEETEEITLDKERIKLIRSMSRAQWYQEMFGDVQNPLVTNQFHKFYRYLHPLFELNATSPTDTTLRRSNESKSDLNVFVGRDIFTEEHKKNLVFLFVSGLYSGFFPGNKKAPEVIQTTISTVQRVCGLDMRFSSIPTDGSCLHNARIIYDEISTIFHREGKQVVVIGYSKGSADVTTCICMHADVRRMLRGFVSLMGAFGGSAIASECYEGKTRKAIATFALKEFFDGVSPTALRDITLEHRDAFLKEYPYPIPPQAMAYSRNTIKVDNGPFVLFCPNPTPTSVGGLPASQSAPVNFPSTNERTNVSSNTTTSTTTTYYSPSSERFPTNSYFTTVSLVASIKKATYEGSYPAYTFIKHLFKCESDGLITTYDACIPGSMVVYLRGMDHKGAGKKNPVFKHSPSLLASLLAVCLYGDPFQNLVLHVHVIEAVYRENSIEFESGNSLETTSPSYDRAEVLQPKISKHDRDRDVYVQINYNHSDYCGITQPKAMCLRNSQGISSDRFTFVWNEAFSFNMTDIETDCLTISLLDKHRVREDRLVAQLQLPTSALANTSGVISKLFSVHGFDLKLAFSVGKQGESFRGFGEDITLQPAQIKAPKQNGGFYLVGGAVAATALILSGAWVIAPVAGIAAVATYSHSKNNYQKKVVQRENASWKTSNSSPNLYALAEQQKTSFHYSLNN